MSNLIALGASLALRTEKRLTSGRRGVDVPTTDKPQTHQRDWMQDAKVSLRKPRADPGGRDLTLPQKFVRNFFKTNNLTLIHKVSSVLGGTTRNGVFPQNDGAPYSWIAA